MANSTATTIDQTAEKQLGTDTTLDRLTVTRENVDIVCKAAAAAGVKISAEGLRCKFDKPTSHKLAFYFAEWKEQNRALTYVQPKSYYVALSESQAATINEQAKLIDELQARLIEWETESN